MRRRASRGPRPQKPFGIPFGASALRVQTSGAALSRVPGAPGTRSPRTLRLRLVRLPHQHGRQPAAHDLRHLVASQRTPRGSPRLSDVAARAARGDPHEGRRAEGYFLGVEHRGSAVRLIQRVRAAGARPLCVAPPLDETASVARPSTPKTLRDPLRRFGPSCSNLRSGAVAGYGKLLNRSERSLVFAAAAPRSSGFTSKISWIVFSVELWS